MTRIRVRVLMFIIGKITKNRAEPEGLLCFSVKKI